MIIILIILSLHSIIILSKKKLQKEIKYGRFRDTNSIPKEEIDRIKTGIAEVEVDLQKISNRLKGIHSILDSDKVKHSVIELKDELNKQKDKLYRLEKNIKKLPIDSFSDLRKDHYKQEKKLNSMAIKIYKYLPLKYRFIPF